MSQDHRDRGAAPAHPGPPAATLDGRRLSGPGAPAAVGEVTYTVRVEPPAPVTTSPVPSRPAPAGDKRGGRSRHRTRLRTGKIVDAAGRFLTECLIHDRSEAGGRLRLPVGTTVPLSIQLFEDQGATLLQADVVWRTEHEIGVRIRPGAATARTRAIEAEMRRRFYAVRD